MNFKNEDDTMRIKATQKDGKYVLEIWAYRTRGIYSKRGSYKTWTKTVKTFDTAKQANAYFVGIKKNNPTLHKS